MNFSEFSEKILVVTETTEAPHNLEQFLLAVWRISLENKDTPTTWKLFYNILVDAWVGGPSEFDESWYKIKESPDITESKTELKFSDFEYFKGTILFQIADLHGMREAGYWKPDSRSMYDGVISPRGEAWYNLSPDTFCQCGVAGLVDHAKSKESYVDVLDDIATWRNFAEMLHLGQLYE